MQRITTTLAALLLTTATALAADIDINSGWIRMVPPVAENSAAYLTLHNRSHHPVTLRAITSDCCRKAAMHTMTMVNHRMKMRLLPQITIAAGGKKRFAPGGDHIMLMGLTQPLAAGARISLTLHFADGHTMQALLPVVDKR
ncbi:MAG: copper chaperone PCu(A)C [Mariprofundales bacterium]